MVFLRSMMVVLDGRGELGIMRPLASTVRGADTRLPLMHCRQLMNWVAEDMMSHLDPLKMNDS